ncbi:HXXEE domain-containing protein [Nonomuraea pusilla]|uniref:HXXEE domain-containing protein n=1 Tax=Nonomuraea pusilla TaxID=46177 RepID=UPI00331F7E63
MRTTGAKTGQTERAGQTSRPDRRPAETAGLGRGVEGRVSSAVTWGLLAAWAVHDAEELATMAGWARRARPRLERLFPRVPWQRLEVSQRQVTTAIALMGGVMAGASALGARTGGRSPVFQAALAGFGAHGVVHLAQAAVTRGYTPGVVTSPLVVIPFSLWAWRRLRESGVAAGAGGATAAGLAALPAVAAGVHVLAHALSGRADARHGGQAPGKDRCADARRGDLPGRAGRSGKVGGGVRRERWF